MADNVDRDGIQVLTELDADGRFEHGDPTPVAPPIGIRKGMSMAERIQLMVRRELSGRAEDLGMESFEEANDFDIPDDPLDPSTPYEEQFDPVEKAAAERLKNQEMLDRIEKRHKEMRARKYPQEATNGDSAVDQRGDGPDRSGSGKSGKVAQDDPKPEPDVQGGGSKTTGARDNAKS